MRKLAHTVALFSVLSCFGLAQAGVSRIDNRNSPATLTELQIKANQVIGASAIVPQAFSGTYSATTVGGPTYTRTFADCSGLSGVGVGVNYHAQSIVPAVTGSYSISSVQDGTYDGMVFVYDGTFNPANALTNCIVGNDDGAGSVGTSDIPAVALTAGNTYVIVTTSFNPAPSADSSGTFTNTISGPGAIAGLPDLVSITKLLTDAVAIGGNFSYELEARNTTDDTAATGVVATDILPPGLSFVSSTCGATAAGNTITWNIGALALDSSANCTITVTNASSVCAVVSNTATITATEVDPNLGNNASTVDNAGTNAVADPSFEDGGSWTEASSNFSTPVCDAGCGTGSGTGPRTGAFWTWFGGFPDPGSEVASMEQSVTIPVGAPTITFWVEFPVCATANGAGDFVALSIDGSELWREDATSARCNTVGYQQVSVPLTAGFANGAAHTVRFDSTTIGGDPLSNFFVDDVEITSAPSCVVGVGPVDADLALTKTTPTVTASVGDTVTYTLTASNAGPGAATPATVTDSLPAGLTYVSNNCGATYAAPTLTWNIPTMLSGSSSSCTVTTTVAMGASGNVLNSAVISSPTSDPTSANNTGSSTISVLGEATAVPTMSLLGLFAMIAGLGGFAWLRTRSIA